MTLKDIITDIKVQRPSGVDDERIVGWINEVEQRVLDEVIGHSSNEVPEWEPYNYIDNEDTELLIPDVYAGVYETYVFAKEDYMFAESDRYNFDALAHEAEWKAYASWYRRNNYPKAII